MGKVKSAICLILTTLIIAAACFFVTVTFSYDDGLHTWHSLINLTKKDATLGGTLLNGDYTGGSYAAVYYPEGVITYNEYENNLEGYDAAIGEYESRIASEQDAKKVEELKKSLKDTQDKRGEYAEKYTRKGTLCFETEKAIENGEISDEFKASFRSNVTALKERFGALDLDGAKLSVLDGYTVQVTLPQMMSSQSAVYTWFAYTGELTVLFGTDEDSATKVLPENKRDSKIGDYVKGFSTRAAADGQQYVSVAFTAAGAEAIKTATAEPESSSALYFKVGDDTVISLRVESQLDQKTLYIGGNDVYNSETVAATTSLLNSALKGTQAELKMTVGDMYRLPASFGDNALMLVYIAFGVCFVGMMVFFFARYGLLGFVHLYNYLIFLFALLICLWGIPFIYLSAGTVLAVLLTSVLLAVSTAITYEYARKQFATGKTMSVSVKNGYKKCFWHIFDIHIALAAFSFVLYAIALPGLSAFAFTLGLGTLFSGVCALAIGRLNWASMMAFTKNQSGFCRFKKVEVEDDE